MEKPIHAVFILIFIFSLLSCCVVVVHNSTEEGNAGPSEEYRKRIPFNSGGRIHLENKNGQIEILGWENDEVEITAWQRETGGGDIWCRSENAAGCVRTRSQDRSLWINTELRGGDGETNVLDYFLRVPHSVDVEIVNDVQGGLRIADVYGRLSAVIGEGDVRVENFSGSIRISVDSGSAEVEVLDLRSEDAIAVATRKGDVILSLQKEACGEIDAEAPAGQIIADFDLQAAPSAHKLTTRIGEGKGASISLLALDGDIKIRTAQ